MTSQAMLICQTYGLQECRPLLALHDQQQTSNSLLPNWTSPTRQPSLTSELHRHQKKKAKEKQWTEFRFSRKTQKYHVDIKTVSMDSGNQQYAA